MSMGFLVTFKQDACKGCELCMAFCSRMLIVADKSVMNKSGIHPAAITDTTQCVGCLNCTLMCADAVITVEKIEE